MSLTVIVRNHVRRFSLDMNHIIAATHLHVLSYTIQGYAIIDLHVSRTRSFHSYDFLLVVILQASFRLVLVHDRRHHETLQYIIASLAIVYISLVAAPPYT